MINFLRRLNKVNLFLIVLDALDKDIFIPTYNIVQILSNYFDK